MWIQKQENGKYRFFERFPLPGRKYKTISVTLEKNNAMTRKLAAQLLAEKGGQVAGTSFTLQQILDAYYKDQLKTVRPQTAHRNFGTLSHFVRLIGPNTHAEDLTAGMVRRILLSQDKSETWRNEYVARFKAMMNWAYRNDYIEDKRCADKLQKFELPVSARAGIDQKYMTQDELALVLDALAPWPHWQLVARFLALSGLRFGEFAALLPGDFTETEIRINKTFNASEKVTNDPKNFNSVREISIQKELADVVKDINVFVKKEKMKNALLRDVPYWFPNVCRMKPKQKEHICLYAFDRRFKAVTKKTIGKELTAHALRHTHASLLFQEGLSYDAVGRRLGHGGNSRVTREIYVHITAILKKKDAAALDNIRILTN